jgi:hypothetical protein
MSAVATTRPTPVAPDDCRRRLADKLGLGAAVVVATRDEALRPHIARGWAVELFPEERLVRLCVEAADGSRAMANLTGAPEIAVTLMRPSTYRSVQMKGTLVGIQEPTDDQRRGAEEHQLALSDESAMVGLSPRLAVRLLRPEALVSVTLLIDEIYDQTPGPTAGARL